MNSILVTGGAGFIGSNFLNYFSKKYPDYRLVNVDKLTYAGNLDNVGIFTDKRYFFEKGDICDTDFIEYIFNKYRIDGVVHFAAESHVDNSIANPDIFVKTNVNGTFNLLNVAYRHWMLDNFVPKEGYGNSRFHHVSTDEVYGSLGNSGYFTEDSPYRPNSPYSATKASSDMLVRSYYKTYGLDVVISNCSNNFGPNQHREKLIPTIIRKALNGESIPVYGNGSNVRDWLYVLDHCIAIDLIFHKGLAGNVYNIGASNELDNNTLVLKICEIVDAMAQRSFESKNLITYIKDRPGHDFRYAIDATKLTSSLGWQPIYDFEHALTATVQHYLNIFMAERNA